MKTPEPHAAQRTRAQRLHLGAAFACIALAACSGGSDSSAPPAAPAPAPVPTPPPPPAPSAGPSWQAASDVPGQTHAMWSLRGTHSGDGTSSAASS